ncbi:MAG: phosphoribosyl-ATP diphosphatase [Clostridiales Family XIII bacterium]|jgi:phosphoribosyl-ATP pyrophosphohydrolase|nr:phosphoribosyl-ATP diphosphatase [Clostridiales Family XIII bacterium]
MADLLSELYEIVLKRRDEKEEGSYTAYLFEQGLDKILKKVGEESSETIIAAKNLRQSGGAEARQALVGEIGDLLYHVEVMMAELGVTAGELKALLRERMEKQGNLKQARQTDRDT